MDTVWEMGRTAAATADLTAAAVARAAGGASSATGAGEAATAGRGMRVLNPSEPSRKLISAAVGGSPSHV